MFIGSVLKKGPEMGNGLIIQRDEGEMIDELL